MTRTKSLKEAAERYSGYSQELGYSRFESTFNAFLAGARWQKRQDIAAIRHEVLRTGGVAGQFMLNAIEAIKKRGKREVK